MKLTYTHTRIACYLSFMNAAVATNLIGLLLTTLQDRYGIGVEQAGSLMAISATVLIFLIPLSTAFSGRVGFRVATVLMQICYFIGIFGLGVLPNIIDNAYAAVAVAIVFYSVGIALGEANINAIIESLPSDKKETELSLLHSVYSWASLAVILFTTIFFAVAGRNFWYVLPVLFAIVPLLNTFLFLKVPFMPAVEEGERTPLKQIITSGFFILLLIFIFCEGAAELCMPQWASMFAENALNVPKAAGDLLGPGLFTLGMAVSRIWYGFKGQNIRIEKVMIICSIASALSYMIVVFGTIPMLSLVGCGLLGISVGILSPGVFTLTGMKFPKGGVYAFGAVSSFMYIGIAISTKAIGAITGYVEQTQPAFLANLIPATSAFDLGIRSSFLIVGLLAVVMTFVIAAASRKLSKD